MKKTLSVLFILFIGSFILNAQTTFGLKLAEISNDGTNYVVSISLQMNGDDATVFKLGSSSLQFSFPDDALSNPVLESTSLAAPFPYYEPTITTPLTDQCSFNVELAVPEFGVDITEGPLWLEIGQISFTIDDASALNDLAWTYTGGTTGTVIFLDNESTQIFASTPSEDNLIFESMDPPPAANVRLVSVNPTNHQITFKNFGDADQDISAWRLCSNFNYTGGGMQGDGNITIINGDYILSANEEMTVEWTPGSGFRDTGDDIGIYLATGAFSSAAAMVDFMQYLSAGNGRESVAVAKGIWSTGDFVVDDAPYTYNGTGADTGVQFWQGQVVITDCSDLLISEYGEPDGGNGKYVELYNASDSDIDLSNYALWKISNGGTFPENEIALTGILGSGSAFLIANNVGDIPSADLFDTFVMNFNGDDAIGLAKNGVLIDAVGEEGPDPGSGFAVAGINSATQNHTIRRKSTVLAPNTDWTSSAGTDELDSEWEVLDYNTDNIGIHVTECVEASDDADGDGILDTVDNCPTTANADQADLDQDEIGDVCDSDIDGDGVLNDVDCDPLDASIFLGATCDDGDPETLNDVYQSNCSCAGNIPVPACTELFISEYGEPNGGNGKYIEIYNSSSATIDLSGYSLWKIGNGGSWPESTLVLSGNLDANTTYVIANNVDDVPGADLYDSGIINFNGDDAMGLAKDTVLIDAIGQEGPDPGNGFDVAGISEGTKDHTLIRKATIQSPNVSWLASAGTDAVSSEWEVVDYTIANIGQHVSPCGETADQDEDTIPDDVDNCPTIANMGQADMDDDGEGDACDDDIDGDGFLNENDCDPFDANVNEFDDASFTYDNYNCNEMGGPTEFVFQGGTFTFNPAPTDGSTINSVTGTISGTTPGASYTIEYTTDGSCPSSFTQTVMVLDDTTAPVISELTDITIECNEAIPDPIAPNVTDDCDPNVEIEYLGEEILEDECDSQIIRTWSATDASGNTTTSSMTINIVDTTSPVFDLFEPEITIPCGTEPMELTATDNCNSITIETGNSTTSELCYGTGIYDYIATDACGNSTTVTQIVHYSDDIAPEFDSFPSDQILSCGDDVPEITTPTGSDNCDFIPTIEYIGETITGVCPMTIIRTWTITDCPGNEFTQTQTISFVNTDAISFTFVPGDVTQECDLEINEELATATTLVECGIAAVTFEDIINSDDVCNTIISRTFTATDGCGNIAQATQTITLIDTTAPVFDTYPLEIDLVCDEEITIITATDNCSEVTITFTDEILDDESCAGSIVRTFTAVDECGNTATSDQIIHYIDEIAPVFTSTPENMNLSCGDVIPEINTPTFADNCSEVTIEFIETQEGTCPMTIIRIWTISDECGNSTEITQTITFENNNTPPVFTFIPADITIDCGDEIPSELATATSENCGTVTVVLSQEIISGGCGAIITNTYTATDECGNISTAVQTVFMDDTTAPEIISEEEDLSLQCEAEVQIAIAPTATDNCDDNLNIVLTESVSGSCPKIITRMWEIMDNCGNLTFSTQTITILDTEAPTFTDFPADENYTCNDEVPTAVTPTVFDNCTVNITPTMTEEITGECPDEDMTITRTWTAVDDCGNIATAMQTLTFSNTNSIDQINGFEFSLIINPNPVSNILSISVDSDSNRAIEMIIYNSIGQVIINSNENIQSGENKISLSVIDLETGVYFIKLINTSHTITKSFIKR